jgi:hypothetical protein
MFFGVGRRSRPATETDLQSRVRLIDDECRRIAGTSRVPGPEATDLQRLAHYVSYLAAIVEKHLRTEER